MDAATSPAAASQQQPEGHAAGSPWDIPLAGWKEVAIRTWRQSSEDNVSVVAAGVAFYGFVALVPLLGASILIYGLVADPQDVVRHATSLTQFMPRDVAEMVGQQLINVVETSGGKKGLGLLLAIAISLWGARNAAGSVITALNIAYEEEEERGFLKVLLLSLIMTVAAVVMALLAGGAIALLAALEALLPGMGPFGVVMGKVMAYVLLGAAAAAGAAAMFRFGPSRDRAQWAWITPGSLFFAAAWIILTLAFGFYVSKFGNYGATYGPLSAVIVLLTWLYLSSYILLLAAELNSELERQTAEDTTDGKDQPLGQRGAWAADNVAGGSADGEGRPAPTPEQAEERSASAQEPSFTDEPKLHAGHPIVTSRITARAGQVAGLPKVGMLSSVLATAGLARLRKRGAEGSGAMILLVAAGLALWERKK